METKTVKQGYVVVAKWKSYLNTFLTIASILTLLTIGVRKWDTTFDNQKQKEQVIGTSKSINVILNEFKDVKTKVQYHQQNQTIHFTIEDLEEKFMTKKEQELRYQYIGEALVRIEKKLDEQ